MAAHVGTSLVSVTDLAGEHYLSTLAGVHEALSPKTYLEIGVFTGSAFALSTCASIAVDPEFRVEAAGAGGPLSNKPMVAFYQKTSDDFFETVNACGILGSHLDFAFLDGMHLCEYLLRDFANTERLCHKRSVIALHDCLPVNNVMTDRQPNIRAIPGNPRAGWWTGDVWRTALLLKRRRPQLRLTVLDSSATGLVLVTGLDPADRSLLANYDGHVAEMMSWHLEDIGIKSLFAELQVTSTSSVTTPSAMLDKLWG